MQLLGYNQLKEDHHAILNRALRLYVDFLNRLNDNPEDWVSVGHFLNVVSRPMLLVDADLSWYFRLMIFEVSMDDEGGPSRILCWVHKSETVSGEDLTHMDYEFDTIVEPVWDANRGFFNLHTGGWVKEGGE